MQLGRPEVLCSPVGGVDAGVGEEAEQRCPLVVQVRHEFAVLVVRMSVIGEHLDPLGQIGDDCRTIVVVEVACVERFGEDVPYFAGCPPLDGRQVHDQLITAPGEMSKATLVCRLFESPVDNPAVTHHDAGELRRDHLAGLLEPPAVGDPVGGGPPARGDPEPGTFAADSPARLVGHDHLRAVHRLSDRVLHRHEIGPPGRRRHRGRRRSAPRAVPAPACHNGCSGRCRG